MAAKGTKTDGKDGGAAVPELSYEESREELNTVVRRLESGGLSLKESLALWERGEELARVCEQWLEGARAKMAAAMDERREDDPPADGDTPF
ncbi:MULTISPECIES: exodeoxyribonuclease VII small subunit [Nocardiopsidaceae]|jgi:exodeoxyribonuclease VII small subunit|uniref:Exodeoxyribonuclease 7 small subunit n=2 Tax=Nocardiopsidaceae TaxID=83676 RepID=A0ABY6YKH9_9ACTN|nr:exodeoxyribonuclease VII small subunit [Streptomonospora nanhaiensis]MEE2046384.1 exodeoxyribonuclease VII small subunit [Nocardiopsis tropica]WAE72735.1 exodeoxyribonuclease VII small subunit [Streptomonospora nanhaiensis]